MEAAAGHGGCCGTWRQLKDMEVAAGHGRQIGRLGVSWLRVYAS